MTFSSTSFNINNIYPLWTNNNNTNSVSTSKDQSTTEKNSLTQKTEITVLPPELLPEIFKYLPYGDLIKNCELVSKWFLNQAKGFYIHEYTKFFKDAASENISYKEIKQRLLMHEYHEYGKKTPVQIKNANDLHRNLTEAKTFEEFVKAFAQAGFVPNQKSEKMDKGDLKSLEDAYHHREWLKEKNNFLFFMCFIPFEKLKDHFILVDDLAYDNRIIGGVPIETLIFREKKLFSPLHFALENKQVDLAYAMLKSPIKSINLNVNEQNNLFSTPLMSSISLLPGACKSNVQNKCIEIIKLLLNEHGAEIEDISLSNLLCVIKAMCINNDKEGIELVIKKMLLNQRVDETCLSKIGKLFSDKDIYINPIIKILIENRKKVPYLYLKILFDKNENIDISPAIKSLIENSVVEKNTYSTHDYLFNILIEHERKAKEFQCLIEMSEKVKEQGRATISEKQIGELVMQGFSKMTRKEVDEAEAFFAIVNRLFEKGYAIDDSTDSSWIRSALHEAGSVTHLENSQLLSIIRHLFKNYMGLQEPWQASASSDLFEDNEKVMSRLLRRTTDAQGNTLIHHAVDRGDIELLSRLLIFFKSSDFQEELFNLKNYQGETPRARVSGFTAEKIKEIDKGSYARMIETLLFTNARSSLDFRTALDCVKAAAKAGNHRLCLRISLEYLKHSIAIVNAIFINSIATLSKLIILLMSPTILLMEISNLLTAS